MRSTGEWDEISNYISRPTLGENEKEAIDYLKNRPRTGIIGVFKGERLQPKIGETKVVKKTVVGFEAITEEKSIEKNLGEN